ncbi:MAG: transposase, partial [Rhabdochlamydiaceae bacterium]
MNSVNFGNKNLSHCVRNARSAGYSVYHLQWVTKYRYATLRKESHFMDCESALRSAAARHGIQVMETGVMED